jgi:hypothetical protein
MHRPTKFDGMMHEFVVGLGWSARTVKDGKLVHLRDFIPDTRSVTADQFVEWLILLDGVENMVGSSQLKRWRRELKAVFVKHMGAEVVDATQLR